jgi:sugar phosphate isomerase/epimerase
MRTGRRFFLGQAGLASLAVATGSFKPAHIPGISRSGHSFFDISLAEFSFASDLWTGKMTNLDFPGRAKNEFGIDAVEYVSMFFNNKHREKTYLADLKQRAADAGVKNNLIMVDGDNLSDLDEKKRLLAVENHYPWVDAAKFLGGNSIRVNLGSMTQPGTPEDEMKAAVDGYGRLLDYGKQAGIQVIVENHLGRSCNAKWLVGVMKQVNHPMAGVLPDFGNFCAKRTPPATNDISGWLASKCLEQYDMYQGVEELMPYAKGVSAKTHKFRPDGEEHEMDFTRLFAIIKKSGFRGYVGIEYEGGLLRDMGKDESYPSNSDGVRATKTLLEKVRKKLA